MREKIITCITCPQSCQITLISENENIISMEGFTCKRGEEYARNEFYHPVRILTSSAKVEGAGVPLVAVRSNKPVPKELQIDCIREIHKLCLHPPIRRYDILIKNILNTGADIVATGNVL